jgi:short-subunit dehydrogenase
MDAATVARQGYEAVMAGEAVCVNGRVNRTIAALARWMPPRLVTAVGRRMAGRYRNAT